MPKVSNTCRNSPSHPLCLNFLQVQKTSELEALRLSLNSVHSSQREHTKLTLQQEHEVTLNSLRETFAQESALLQARYETQLDQMRQQNQEEQEKLRELNQENAGKSFCTCSVFFFYLFSLCCTQLVCGFGCGRSQWLIHDNIKLYDAGEPFSFFQQIFSYVAVQMS